MITEMSFPTSIILGREALKEAPNHLARLGIGRPLIVTEREVAREGLLDRLSGLLATARLPFVPFEASPVSSAVEAGLALYFERGCDGILALGGGGVLDAAKAIRLRVSHPAPLAQYDETADGWRLVQKPVPPLVAVPTTAGAGSEVTGTFIVAEEGRRVVVSARALVPSVAICDPELTYGLRPELTAAGGMEALTQNLEAWVARGFHPLSEALARKGLELCGRFLLRAVHGGRDEEARLQMMAAALSGACAVERGRGPAQSLAHALASSAGLHHGLACALVLPSAMEFDLPAAGPALAEAARILGEPASDDEAALARRAVARVRILAREAGIPERLRDLGVQAEQIPALAELAYENPGHRDGPRPCSPADFEAMLRAAH